MHVTPFHAPVSSKGRAKVFKVQEGLDVAARYFVYKLYEATGAAATISRAVERGWVVLQDVRGKPLDRSASLTDEGRRLARKGR